MVGPSHGGQNGKAPESPGTGGDLTASVVFAALRCDLGGWVRPMSFAPTQAPCELLVLHQTSCRAER
jgi:hypothetical protein